LAHPEQAGRGHGILSRPLPCVIAGGFAFFGVRRFSAAFVLLFFATKKAKKQKNGGKAPHSK
jgi:hypothetical protein